MTDVELTLAQWLDSTWTGRAVRFVTFLLPIGGMIIAFMVYDSREKAEAAKKSAAEVGEVVDQIKESVDGLRDSVRLMQSDLSAVRVSAARTAGVVEQMQLEFRPAASREAISLALPTGQ